MPDRMSEQELNKLINMLELSQGDGDIEFDISFMVSDDPDHDHGGGCWSGLTKSSYRTRCPAVRPQ